MATITIIDAVLENERLQLKPDREVDENWAGTSRLLADSDQHALVYIFEVDEKFVQVRIPENFWSVLDKSRVAQKPVFFMGTNVEFTDFHDELDMFLDYVDDNHNYGPEMVAAVEKHFRIQNND